MMARSFETLLLHLFQIILPNTVCEGGNKTKLYELLSDHYDETNLTTVQRKYFNESKGKHCMCTMGMPKMC